MSFAIRTASSVSLPSSPPITGPKVSSRITFMEWSASAITVGSYQSPGWSFRLPPVRILAPFSRASSTVGDDLDLLRRGHRAHLRRVRSPVGALAQALDVAAELATNSS